MVILRILNAKDGDKGIAIVQSGNVRASHGIRVNDGQIQRGEISAIFLAGKVKRVKPEICAQLIFNVKAYLDIVRDEDAGVDFGGHNELRVADGVVLDRTIVRCIRLRYLDWGVWSLIGEEMYQETLALNQKQLFDSFTTPLKVITAGDSYYEARKKKIPYTFSV